MTLLSHTSSLAQAKNTVTFDPDVKDAWGLPALRITSDYHPDDLATIKWIRSKQIEILQAAGAQKIWCQSVEMIDNMPGRHLMGTCRMGHDPATSVVMHSAKRTTSRTYFWSTAVTSSRRPHSSRQPRFKHSLIVLQTTPLRRRGAAKSASVVRHSECRLSSIRSLRSREKINGTDSRAGSSELRLQAFGGRRLSQSRIFHGF